jgi:hypothetical protein
VIDRRLRPELLALEWQTKLKWRQIKYFGYNYCAYPNSHVRTSKWRIISQ